MNPVKIEMKINDYVEWFLRHWIAAASIFAGLVVFGAVIIPILAANGFSDAAWLGYKLYRPLCPQRPSHSWFIQGYKMGFEQRDTAMFAAAALAGPLWLIARHFGFKSISGKLVLVLIIPILIDVFSQVFGLRDSNGFWRAVTGSLAVFAIAAWLYPRIDTDFQAAIETIGEVREKQKRELARE